MWCLLFVAHALAGNCAVDADLDGFAGGEVAPDGDGRCDSAGERPLAEAGEDCDDTDADVNPAAEEVVGDLIDEDCDGFELCFSDFDDDGYHRDNVVGDPSPDLDCDDPGEVLATAPGGDCDDGDAATHPGAEEIIGDEWDEDCDGQEDCFEDLDADGVRTAVVVHSEDDDCDDPGEAHAQAPADDCDDADATRYQHCPPPDSAELTGSGCGGGLVPLGFLPLFVRRRR